MARRGYNNETTESNSDEDKIKSIVWRDFTFLLLALLASFAISYIEVNAGDASLRGGTPDSRGIVDTGFIATSTLHEWLSKHRDVNDILAFLNTIGCVLLPAVYLVHVTVWVGDYDLAFRYLATQCLRSICGWFTYLPSSPEYLMSYYDVPDIFQCMTKECGDPSLEEVQPFVSFFSGHVATLVCCANHMYTHGYRRLGIVCHVINVLQIIRLLSSRGHYSIDIIIGWYVAIYVSRSAGRLGRYYSRGARFRDFGPKSRKEAFETFIGVNDDMRSRRFSMIIREQNLEATLLELENDDFNVLKQSVHITTAKLAARGTISLNDERISESGDSANDSGHGIKKRI